MLFFQILYHLNLRTFVVINPLTLPITIQLNQKKSTNLQSQKTKTNSQQKACPEQSRMDRQLKSPPIKSSPDLSGFHSQCLVGVLPKHPNLILSRNSEVFVLFSLGKGRNLHLCLVPCPLCLLGNKSQCLVPYAYILYLF